MSGMSTNDDIENSTDFVKRKLKAFIRNFQVNQRLPYREQLTNNYSLGVYFIDVRIEDLMAFDDKLTTKIQEDPAFYIPLVLSILFTPV